MTQIINSDGSHVKSKTLQVLVENMGECCSDLAVGKNILSKTQKSINHERKH